MFRFFVANRRNKLTSRHSIMFFSRISIRQKYAVVPEKPFKLGCPYLQRQNLLIQFPEKDSRKCFNCFYILTYLHDYNFKCKHSIFCCNFLSFTSEVRWPSFNEICIVTLSLFETLRRHVVFSFSYAIWYRNVFHTRLKTLAWTYVPCKIFVFFYFSRFSEENEFIL